MIFQPPRQSLFLLLVSFLLLLGQQQAVLHQINHFQQTSEKRDLQQIGEEVCEKCGIYAQLSGGVHAAAHAIALTDFSGTAPTCIQAVAVATAALTARNRGPPVFL